MIKLLTSSTFEFIRFGNTQNPKTNPTIANTKPNKVTRY